MRKLLYAAMALVLLSVQNAGAQTILKEDFETGATESKSTPLTKGEGWTTVSSYSGTNFRYNWYNYYSDPDSQSGPTISGAGCAACDGPITASGVVDGSGPREEILLSPELNLDDNYQLQFSWKVSPMNAQDYSRYDLQVRVVTDNNLAGAELVFSIQNEQMLRESGVTVFPINTWDLHISKVDLSDWKGEKVKLAFVYKMLATSSNIAWIDDITVKKFTPATGPVASVNLDRYDFKEVYIGEKFFSEVFTLTNVGKNGLTVTGMDLPQGISTTLDADINLRAYDKVNFQLAYEASMTSPASGTAVIHTTGGDVKIDFTASKQLVPEDCQLETFNDYFPPAGWKNNGWSATNKAIEGDNSVYCSGDFSNSYLRSPRLDLSEGGKLKFAFYDQYEGDYAPEYDIQVQVSYDGGDSWTTKWTRNYETELNQLLTVEVDLGMGTDESYVRWFYPAVETDDEGAYDHSSFTLDRVLLPHVYGVDGVPGKVTMIAPANNSENVYPKDIVLQWGPAQFAKGYRVYVGSNAEMNNLVDGADVLNMLSMTIPQADYETTYKWKVVAYNDKGDATEASTWRFTTQPDASVMEFPWEENFDTLKDKEVPMGWLSSTTNQYAFAAWGPNTIYPYGGTGASLAAGWMNAGSESVLVSPEFNLPAGGTGMTISFVWGDEHPADLIIDETGLLKKQNKEGGNGYSDVVFEIFADGQWTQLSYLSEDHIEGMDGKKYWRNEHIDLMDYAGKKVQFRWISHSYGSRHDGAALDNVVINGSVGDYAVFNKDGWDAGKVNYGKAVNSGDQFTLINQGKNDLKVKSVTFNSGNFQSSIAVGQEIAKGEGVSFNVQFNAGELNGAVEDVMTVEFEGGSQVTFPVKGEGLAADVLYYGFEKNPMDYDWKTDFTTIDADNQVTYRSNYYLTEIEDNGGRIAFTQAIHHNPNLTAHSGIGTLVAVAPDNNSAANDWLISKLMYLQEGATLDFYARNLGTTGSVFVGDNDLHSVEVLVSETGNTKTTDFKTVMNSREMDYLDENEWYHFNVDLSAYAGKNVYVAVRHTTVSANWMAFFDDMTFTHVGDPDPSAVKALKMDENAEVAVYTAGGVLVARGRSAQVLSQLKKGMYVVKTADGQTVKTVRK
jgi:hypothetical protein